MRALICLTAAALVAATLAGCVEDRRTPQGDIAFVQVQVTSEFVGGPPLAGAQVTAKWCQQDLATALIGVFGGDPCYTTVREGRTDANGTWRLQPEPGWGFLDEVVVRAEGHAPEVVDLDDGQDVNVSVAPILAARAAQADLSFPAPTAPLVPVGPPLARSVQLRFHARDDANANYLRHLQAVEAVCAWTNGADGAGTFDPVFGFANDSLSSSDLTHDPLLRLGPGPQSSAREATFGEGRDRGGQHFQLGCSTAHPVAGTKPLPVHVQADFTFG